MADEFRRITFANSEVREAICRPGANPVKGHLGGDVTALLLVHSEGEYLFEVTMFDQANDEENKVYFREDDLIKSIVGHCHDNNIPLPWTSTKKLSVVELNPTGELRVIDSRLCLDVSMGEMATMPPLAEPTEGN